MLLDPCLCLRNVPSFMVCACVDFKLDEIGEADRRLSYSLQNRIHAISPNFILPNDVLRQVRVDMGDGCGVGMRIVVSVHRRRECDSERFSALRCGSD